MSFRLRTEALGREVGRSDTDITFRATAAYAAAIGAEEDRYLDDGVPGGPVAPPGFAVVLEWPLLLRQPYIGLIGADPTRFFEHLLHAFQDTHVHRLVRPGDRLRTRAVLTELRGTSAGALVVCRVDTHCRETGEPVTTSWIGSLFRGCPVDGEACSVEAPALAPALAPPMPADSGQRSPIEVSRALPFIYTEGSGHWNPIHTERAFARAAGYPDLVVHGTATWAIACQRLIDAHAQGDPARLRRFGARFSGVLTPGRTIALRHAELPGEAGRVAFAVHDADERPLLTRGTAAFAAPALP